MNIRQLPSLEVLRKYFDYDNNGNLISAIDITFANCSRKTGQILGSKGPTQKPYLFVRINGQQLLVHRILYKLYHGDFDECMQIDHINGCHFDNRKSNLRLVDNSLNQRNRRKTNRNNTSGAKGVTLDKRTGRYTARIGHNAKNVHLGNFSTFEEARNARRLADKKYNYYML